MSEQAANLSNAIIEDSYLAVCASWREFAQSVLKPSDITYQADRIPWPGLLNITLLFEKQKIATLTIRAATNDRVYLSITRMSKAPQVVYRIFSTFIAWRVVEHDRYSHMPLTVPTADSPDEPLMITTPHPLDAALQEYRQRRASGEMVSLKQIAGERKISYASLRKRHAEQNRTKVEQKLNK